MRIDWRAKALLQAALSEVPGGVRINYGLQRATGGLPLGDDKLRAVVEIAEHHMASIRRWGSVDPADAWFYEFGAGWDLHVPLALYTLGAGRQTVVDLRRLADPALVDDIARRLAADPPAGSRRIPEQADGRPLDEQLAAMAIRYVAPADARRTGFADETIDVITSTNTLEHIPRDDIASILAECRRILRPDGVMSFQIDYQDHYSYFDGRIGPYNFLRYSDRTWRWFNGDLHYQNRLRHDEHLALIEGAGFEVLDAQLTGPDEHDLAVLAALRRADRFADRPLEQVGVRRSLLVLRKAP